MVTRFIIPDMSPVYDADWRIAELNRALAAEGDPARVRYMTSGPSWYDEHDGWHVLAFWELPDPEGSIWPVEVLWDYRGRIQALFQGEDVIVESYFRTREEFESGEHHTGWRVPELA